jgi:hypothetical protein
MLFRTATHGEFLASLQRSEINSRPPLYNQWAPVVPGQPDGPRRPGGGAENAFCIEYANAWLTGRELRVYNYDDPANRDIVHGIAVEINAEHAHVQAGTSSEADLICDLDHTIKQ